MDKRKFRESGGYSIREAREERGWNRQQLADRAGVEYSVIRHLEEKPERARFSSMANLTGIIRALWPDVQLTDLWPEVEFILEPKSRQMRQQLNRERLEG